MSNMKMKKLFAILLASSLASTASSSASELEDEYKYQYYAGLNFGAGWGDTFKMKPSVVFGYNYDKNSKFELEVLANISDITDKQKRKVGASLLANYRYYPELDIDPIKPYVSIGLGGYIQVLPSFGFGTDNKVTSDDDNKGNGGDTNPTISDDDNKGNGGDTNPTISDDDNKGNGGDTNPTISDDDNKGHSTSQSSTLASKAAFSPLVDQILDTVSYKVKLGVDYEIAPQVVGTAAISVGGQLSGLKAMKTPDMMLEVGVRYNF